MLVKNDGRLLVCAAIFVALGYVISQTGVTISPLHLWEVSLNRGQDQLLTHAGYLGWYFVLIYLFAATGWRRTVQAFAPGCVLAILYFTFTKPILSTEGYVLVAGALLGAYLPFLLAFQRLFSTPSRQHGDKVDAMLFFWAGIVLLALLPPTYWGITASLHPTTFDLPLYHFESTMGFLPSAMLASGVRDLPAFQSIVSYAYHYMPLGYAVLLGAQLARPDRPAINLLTAWFVSLLIAAVGYHLLPVAGPKFLFLELFPDMLPPVDNLPLEPSLVVPTARNGVPSMHFAWALLLFLNANLHGARWLRASAAIVLGLNFVATMALGEHFFVDLVIAVPVTVAVQALCMTPLRLNDPLRQRAVVWGIGMWLGWVVALRFGILVFKFAPGLSWIAMIATISASIWLYLPLVRVFKKRWEEAKQQPPERAIAKPTVNPALRWAAAMFVVSGIAGLMYQVLFSKALALTFGSTATATYTVLATYMGGMAIGSWLGGRFAAGRNNPLVLYAFCELGIAAYCALTPKLFQGTQLLYVATAGDIAPDSQALTVFRLALGIGALLPPTILMGITLPVLARFFEKQSKTLGSSVAVLYGANTVGAAFGALLTGYFVIPALGVFLTTLTAALLNLFVALAAFRLQKRMVGSNRAADHALAPPAVDATRTTTVSPESIRLARLALMVLGIGGVVTLAIEINYIHLLAVVAGNSTYAFSLMLFTFLLGLGAGAEVARRILQKSYSLGLVLSWLEFGLAIVILAGVFSWSDMPGYFANFAMYPIEKGFAFREVIRGIVCWLAMFPPALFIGAIYPVAMECIGRANPSRTIQSLGYAAALNTLGNIAGVFLAGFVLLPLVGALKSIQLLAAVCITLGVITLWRGTVFRPAATWIPAGVAIIFLVVQPTSLNYTELASGANVYFARQDRGQVIDHAESIDGGLTSVALKESPGVAPVKTLLTNGKFQGNDSRAGEMHAQLGFSLSPLLHTSHRERALVIGYGTGFSARVLRESGFKQLDIVDLSADIIRLANENFADINDRVTEKAGVATYVTDGRNFLLLQNKRYDLVGLEISSIWFAGAASLYNKEFYHLVKQRLQPHGVLQQWMQLHHIDQFDVMRILGSVRSEFRYVWLYVIGGQGIIIATNDSTAMPTQNNALLLKGTASLQPLITILNSDPEKLLDAMLLDPDDSDRLLNGFGVPATYWVSTDDNLALEYSTPKGNVLDGKISWETNRQFIARYSDLSPPLAKTEFKASQ